MLKFLLTFLRHFCDAYLFWFNKKNRQYESIRLNDHLLFYELEWNFYFMLIREIISKYIKSIKNCFVFFFNYLISQDFLIYSSIIVSFSGTLVDSSVVT